MLVITYANIGISSWGYELVGSIGWSDELDGVMEVVLTLQPHLYAGYYLRKHRDLRSIVPTHRPIRRTRCRVAPLRHSLLLRDPSSTIQYHALPYILQYAYAYVYVLVQEVSLGNATALPTLVQVVLLWGAPCCVHYATLRIWGLRPHVLLQHATPSAPVS